jgi:hypothetical protein
VLHAASWRQAQIVYTRTGGLSIQRARDVKRGTCCVVRTACSVEARKPPTQWGVCDRLPRRVCSVEAGVELAICGEDIWTTKGAKPRERHEIGHHINGIEVGNWVERGACSVLRVPWSYVSRFTFHA